MSTVWTCYLLCSPTRSSLVGVCELTKLTDVINELNAAPTDPTSPVALVRPWRLAHATKRGSKEAAEAVAAAVSRASGFRARLSTLRSLGDREVPSCDAGGFDPSRALDGMTYATIEVRNPEDPRGEYMSVRALVDTGSTDCEVCSCALLLFHSPLSPY